MGCSCPPTDIQESFAAFSPITLEVSAEPGWLALPTRLLRLMLHAMLHLGSSHLWLHCTIRSRDAVCAEHSGCQVPHVKGRRVSFSKDYVSAHLKIGI